MDEQVVLQLPKDPHELLRRLEESKQSGLLKQEAKQIALLIKRLREAQLLSPEKVEERISI